MAFVLRNLSFSYQILFYRNFRNDPRSFKLKECFVLIYSVRSQKLDLCPTSVIRPAPRAAPDSSSMYYLSWASYVLKQGYTETRNFLLGPHDFFRGRPRGGRGGKAGKKRLGSVG